VKTRFTLYYKNLGINVVFPLLMYISIVDYACSDLYHI
jgi:hypothetical protein